MHIIGGEWKNHPITAPKGNHTRPTSGRLRETLFNICQHYIEGARVLDLFAGSGAIGLEALSRGATHCTFVDSSLFCVRCIRGSLEAMQLTSKGRVHKEDVFAWLDSQKRNVSGYTIIYADPPYDASMKTKDGDVSFSQAVLSFVDKHALLQKGGVLFIEDSTNFNPAAVPLQHLTLVNTRKVGRSSLLQFEHLTN